MWRMCALWTFMIPLFYVLPNLHARNCSMPNNRGFLFLLQQENVCKLHDFYLVEFFSVSSVSLFLIRCAWNLHACLLWLRSLEMRLNIACRFCMWRIPCLTVALTNAAFVLLNWTYASVKQRVESCRCVILPCDFSRLCQKHSLPSFSYFDTEKSHTQSRYCVALSFCSSKAALFAFSGQRPAVKEPYLLLSMFHSLSLSALIDWVFVFDCSVLACSP